MDKMPETPSIVNGRVVRRDPNQTADDYVFALVKGVCLAHRLDMAEAHIALNLPHICAGKQLPLT